jgi:hypothetical protein
VARGAGSRSRADVRRTATIHQSPEIIVTAYPSHVEDVRAIRSSRERVATLLRRYPKVSESDRKEILAFMKEGRHLDIGLLTANDNLRPKLDRFMADHRRHFEIDAGDVIRVLAMIAAALMVAWLLWELVRPAHL